VAGERDWDREWEWDRKGEIELVARLLLLAPGSLALLAVSVGGAASFACPRPGKGLCCGRRPFAEVIARKKSLGQLFPPLFFIPILYTFRMSIRLGSGIFCWFLPTLLFHSSRCFVLHLLFATAPPIFLALFFLLV